MEGCVCVCGGGGERKLQQLQWCALIRMLIPESTSSFRAHSHKDVISIINMRESFTVIIDPVEATVVHIHHHHLWRGG